MTDEAAAQSRQAAAQDATKARRHVKAALREASFGALAAGWSLQQIAEKRKVSVKTVRREIDRAIDGRRLDAPDRYIHLQVARLTKELRVADAGLDRGELREVGPLLKVVAALDRYHGLKARSARLARRAAPPPPLPAPPLELTHALLEQKKGQRDRFFSL